MIRDAHWYALATGERSSEGVVTWHARNACVRAKAQNTAFGYNSREDSDLRWHGRAKSEHPVLPSASAGTAIYRTLLRGVNRPTTVDCAFFHKVRLVALKSFRRESLWHAFH